MARGKSSITKTLVWGLLILVVMGFGAFGTVSFSGGVRGLGDVGQTEITSDAYARTLQNEMQALQAQTGQPVTMAQAQQWGLTDRALAQVVTSAALDEEARRIGLSVGDAQVAEELAAISAFQGPDGSFSRDGYAMALRAGADLIDMEFPQFFPIGHLAPRLVGMDPIMWDPFRYKLGGRLFNAEGEEFLHKYGGEDAEKYTTTRDIISYGITKEHEAGLTTENGGVHLSFQHIPEEKLREAFGPVIDKLAANGIDLTKDTVEVAPIAHYHMGGIRVNGQMETSIAGLFGAGEVVGGANGANRLSGNAIPEAFVFGERAGRFAAEYARGRNRFWSDAAAQEHLDLINTLIGRQSDASGDKAALGEMWFELQNLMWEKVGVLRTGDKLSAALTRIRELRVALADMVPADDAEFNMTLQDWYDLRSALLTAESVTLAAINRTESRGAHQREDFEEMDPAQVRNQRLRLGDDGAVLSDYLPVAKGVAA